MSKKFIAIIALSFNLLFLASCTQSSTVMKQTEPDTTQSTSLPNTPLPPTAVPDTPVPTKKDIGPDCTGDLSRPEIKVIYDYADALNKKQYAKAHNLKYASIQGGDTDNNYAIMRNIAHMEIKLLIEKTDRGSWWNSPHMAPREHFCSYKIFYAEVEYKINNIVESGMHDGIMYQKFIIVQERKDSPWLIAEMSGMQEYEKDY